MRAEPDISYASVEDHYRHGAIGLGSDSRIPYWIWKMLPDMFPEKQEDRLFCKRDGQCRSLAATHKRRVLTTADPKLRSSWRLSFAMGFRPRSG